MLRMQRDASLLTHRAEASVAADRCGAARKQGRDAPTFAPVNWIAHIRATIAMARMGAASPASRGWGAEVASDSRGSGQSFALLRTK